MKKITKRKKRLVAKVLVFALFFYTCSAALCLHTHESDSGSFSLGKLHSHIYAFFNEEKAHEDHQHDGFDDTQKNVEEAVHEGNHHHHNFPIEHKAELVYDLIGARYLLKSPVVLKSLVLSFSTIISNLHWQFDISNHFARQRILSDQVRSIVEQLVWSDLVNIPPPIISVSFVI